MVSEEKESQASFENVPFLRNLLGQKPLSEFVKRSSSGGHRDSRFSAEKKPGRDYESVSKFFK